MPTLEDIRLGHLAVAHGLAQPMEVEECLTLQHRKEQEDRRAPLGDILVEHGYLTRTQLDRLLAMDREAVQKVTRIGHYDLLRKLGEGGMGAVYQARDSRNNRAVALKVLPRSRAGSGDKVFLRRFEAEARAAFELNHPNIVRGFDYGYADGYHFLVMEYVEGQDVYQILNVKGRFNESEALHVLEQIASALGHIHEEQLVHRDIKPENIMITTDGVAKLTDMGLALDREEWGRRRITQTGMAMGTPYYLAPEQIQGESEASIRSDIYSLGATVYEMVTGRPPFEGETATVVMVKHLNEQVPSPHDIDKDISIGFCHILEKMMAKKPEHRYQEPAEVLEDLLLVKEGKEPRTSRPEPDQSSIARSQCEQRVRSSSQAESSSARRPAVEVGTKVSGSTRPEIRAAATRRAEKARARATAAPMGSIRWVILAGVAVGLLTAALIILLRN